MTEAAKPLYMTVDEYLAAEEFSGVRHEYVSGQIFAMTGATDAHNRICGNLHAILHAHLRGSGCSVYINDMKVRIDKAESFYYPDLMVTCEPYSAGAVFKLEPVLIIEVLSPSSKTTDRREKLVGYKHIASLQNYAVVYQDRMRVELYCRASKGHWELTVLNQDDCLFIDSLAGRSLTISVSSIYEDCQPHPSMMTREEEADYESSLA